MRRVLRFVALSLAASVGWFIGRSLTPSLA